MISKTIAVALETLGAFLLRPANLAQWTVHRALFEKDGQWYEVRRHPDGHLHHVALDVSRIIMNEKYHMVQFQWQTGNLVQFHLQQLENHCCTINITLPASLPAEKAQVMTALLQTELDILQSLLEHGSTANIPVQHWYHLQNYHLNMYL